MQTIESTDPDQDLPQDESGWRAILSRDPAADGHFVYSVRTTGVYCRPSCPSRQARRENVAFHATPAEAERAGFRPCRRCRPDAMTSSPHHASAIMSACRLIDEAESPPALATLAKSAGMSPSHFHRTFKAATGVTPRAFADARRASKAAETIRSGTTVTEAIYASGFNAASRFYETAPSRLGMKAKAFRDGGAGTSIRFAISASTLGPVLVAMTTRGVCAILLGDDPDALERDLRDRFPHAEIIGGDADFETVVARVVGFVEAPRTGLDLPLDIGGTAFQQRVWTALQKIPPGTTASYAEVAASIGSPAAVRAVGTACGANTIAIAIPCHRVVREDGGEGGYRWGATRKRELLARESS